jgi:squalene synthase HpnC
MRRVIASRTRPAAALSLVEAPVNSGPRPPAAPVEPVPPPPPGSDRWTPDAAYAWCERLARSHYENFPVASRFVPPALRPHVWAIYAFARSADDFADEPRYAGVRSAALDHWEEQLERACYGEAEHPVFVALGETVERRDIPISPLRDLLTSFRMDLTTARYPTFEALLTYMQHSAVPVGRLLLYIFDYRDPAFHRYADDLAVALELGHFLQDVPLDLARGHLYLPEEDLHHFGVRVDDLAEGRVSQAVRDMMRFQTARARALFMRGRPLVDRLGRDLSFELSLMWNGGMAILDQIEAAGGDVFHTHPKLGRLDKLRVAVRSAVRLWR